MNITDILILGFILLAAGGIITTVSVAQEVNINDVHLKVRDGLNAYESDVDSTHMDEDGVDTEDIDEQ